MIFFLIFSCHWIRHNIYGLNLSISRSQKGNLNLKQINFNYLMNHNDNDNQIRNNYKANFYIS